MRSSSWKTPSTVPQRRGTTNLPRALSCVQTLPHFLIAFCIHWCASCLITFSWIPPEGIAPLKVTSSYWDTLRQHSHLPAIKSPQATVCPCMGLRASANGKVSKWAREGSLVLFASIRKSFFGSFFKGSHWADGNFKLGWSIKSWASSALWGQCSKFEFIWSIVSPSDLSACFFVLQPLQFVFGAEKAAVMFAIWFKLHAAVSAHVQISIRLIFFSNRKAGSSNE